MRPLRIALADLSYINNANAHNLYAPLNIGYVAAYAKQKFGAEVDIRLFKEPKALLAYADEAKPDVIGQAVYYWAAELNKVMARKLKERLPQSTIVLGGPCIDSDMEEQRSFLNRYAGADALVPNEGEMGFANIVSAIMDVTFGSAPIAGAILRDGDDILRGASIGLSTNLAEVPSPYITGLMDGFLGGDCRPLVQTARLCPYTCAFCVSGKDRGKLRAFPLDQVKAEIDYIAERFQGDKRTLFYLVDENFGILERDTEIADYILEAKARASYPQRVYFYNDKRFTQLSRRVHEKLGTMCWHGVCLSLQSENPETLKAIKRRNLTDEQLTDAIGWAHGLGLKTSTELIFGLPMETRETFQRLMDKCAAAGFDVIHCYNLIIFDGIEMNRKAYREAHKLKTRFRPSGGNIGWIDGEFCMEADEVVVAADGFTEEDFVIIAKLAIMFQSIFVMGLFTEGFKRLAKEGYSLTEFLLEFLTPTTDEDQVADRHRQFLQDITQAAGMNLLTAEALGEMRRQIVAQVAPDTEMSFPARASAHVNPLPWVAEMIARTSERMEARHAA